MPLLSTPFLLLGEIVRSPEWWATRFNTIVVAVGSGAALWLLRGRVDAGLIRRFLLILLFASFLTNRLRDYNAEVVTATLTVLGLLLVVVLRRPVRSEQRSSVAPRPYGPDGCAISLRRQQLLC